MSARASGKVRMQDIADRMSLSVATVSMALRDHPAVNVGTRQAIRRAARELGYRRRRANLTSTQPIMASYGLVVCDPAEGRYRDPSFEPMVRLLMHDSPLRGVRIQIMGTSSDAALPETRQALEAFAEGLDGLLVSGTIYRPMLQLLNSLGLPYVVIGGTSAEPEDPEAAAMQQVATDVMGMARAAVRYQLARGRRRIALMNGVPKRGFWYDLWRRGYLLAHVEAGLAPEPELMIPYHLGDGSDGWVARLAAARPTADAVIWPDMEMARKAMTFVESSPLRLAPADHVISGAIHMVGRLGFASYPLVLEDSAALTRAAVDRLQQLTHRPTSRGGTFLVPFMMRNMPFSDPAGLPD